MLTRSEKGEIRVACRRRKAARVEREGGEKNKGAGGEMEQDGEENECGRRTNTYVTWACVLRSLSFEPDMVKDSAPVSSTPSESSNGRRKEKRENGEGVEEGGRQRERAQCVNLLM